MPQHDLLIPTHSVEAIRKIEAASRIVADVLQHVGGYEKPGVTTIELDTIAEDFIRTRGGEPAFKGYEVDRKVYPYTLCISVEEEVVHGMPGHRELSEGQIVVQVTGFLAGLVLIVAGYLALSGDKVEGFLPLTLAPILLVLGYCVVIPVGIMYRKKTTAPTTDAPAA